MSDPMPLSAFDFLELQVHGPTGLTEDQYFRIVKAVERIKGAALQDGRLTERECERARKNLTNAKPDIVHAHTTGLKAEALREAAEAFARTVGDRDDPSGPVVCLDMNTGTLTDVQTWLRDRAARIEAGCVLNPDGKREARTPGMCLTFEPEICDACATRKEVADRADRIEAGEDA